MLLPIGSGLTTHFLGVIFPWLATTALHLLSGCVSHHLSLAANYLQTEALGLQPFLVPLAGRFVVGILYEIDWRRFVMIISEGNESLFFLNIGPYPVQ